MREAMKPRVTLLLVAIGRAASLKRCHKEPRRSRAGGVFLCRSEGRFSLRLVTRIVFH
jgi:hypothetical protein